MTTELKEAIEYLKERVAKLKKWKEDGDLTEAIDTVIAEVEKPKYMADDMEAFAEYLIGRNTEWITKLQRNETAKTLIELWEKEMRKKED